jgi:hypothetical protein
MSNGSSMRAPVRKRSTPDAKLKRKAQAMSFLALEALAKILLDADAPAPLRLAAAREVLDRGLGRPKIGQVGDMPEGLTVVVKRFTDAPDPEAGEYEERW